MKKKLILFFSIFGIFSLWNNCLATTQNGSVNVTANIIGCGNNIIENAEECDGTALGGQTCLSRGFFGGTLSCQASCAFNTSSCSTAPPTSSGGGGGWINTVIAALTPTVQIEAKAIFSGRGYSNRKVFLLKDGQFATSTMASADGTFEVSMLNLTYGNYIFGIYGEDIYGNKSILTTLPVSLSGGTTFNYGGIFIAPTITLNKSNIKPGESIQIIGQSTPLAKINIYINTINETILGANTDQGGLYQYTLNTTGLPVDDYLVTARANLDGTNSYFSNSAELIISNSISTNKNTATTTIIEIEDPTTLTKTTVLTTKGDTNSDNKINLIDFSIVAYWYGRSSPPPSADLNHDGKVNLIDLSIMAYNWTG